MNPDISREQLLDFLRTQTKVLVEASAEGLPTACAGLITSVGPRHIVIETRGGRKGFVLPIDLITKCEPLGPPR